MKSDWSGLDEVVAVADAGSFAGAARSLNLSTSHVSRAVADIESRLDVQLFLRTTRRTRLTESGQQFVQLIRPLIEQRNEALSSVRRGREPSGEFRVTCSITLGERFIAPLSLQFIKDHPRVSLSLDFTNRVVDLVGEGYDFGIRTGTIEDDRIWKTQIGARKFHLCASSDYIARFGRPASIEDLSNHTCLVGSSLHWVFQNDGDPIQLTPNRTWQCSSSNAVLNACLSGNGICYLPALYVSEFLELGKLERLLPAHEKEADPIWAICPRQMRFEPTIVAFVDRIRKSLHFPSSGEWDL